MTQINSTCTHYPNAYVLPESALTQVHMYESWLHLMQLVYFMAPAYCANMTPPLTRFWHGWNRPIHERWLGSHKTVVGFVAGVAAALATTALQRWLDLPCSLVDYTSWPQLGLAFGIGAMGGDAAKSFVKRRLHIPPGASWVPFDQLDFVFGALALTAMQVRLPWVDVLVILALTFVGDIVVNRCAFRLGIRESPT